ncbi:PAS domain-containing protein [Vibrio cholerae]|nr:methyl-accepting chemotaxis protein [Vibrio harveyi]EJL6492375.1 PAS domain-containing protein [Vibrio cholerae]EJL6644124.1 PAS domain-containing protein [Vibrio cholerae]MDF4284624.1 methyl-accepting chemotaxis protein [Vibrio parahaemolyticus]
MFFNSALKNELAKTKEKLRSLEQVSEGIERDLLTLTLDANTKIIAANEKFLSQLKVDFYEILETPIAELVPKNCRATDHYKSMVAALAGKRIWNGALQMHARGSADVWLRILILPVFDTKGVLIQFSVIASELTRTITTSREQADLLKALNKSMAVIEFNPGGTVLNANANFLRTMGFSDVTQVSGKHHRIFCSREDTETDEYRMFWRKLAKGEYVTGRFKRIDNYGQVVWLEASYNPIYNDNGELYKVVKFASEITKQVEQEQAVSEAAQVAHDISQKTGKHTGRGKNVVTGIIDQMEELVRQMKQASSDIEALNEHSKAISDLVSNIGGIADQTNLLALNAAIEAARAGEYGRGFSVVADEVRKLAARTNETTETIVKMVSDNLEKTSKAVSLITDCQSRTAEVLGLSTEAGQVLNEVQGGADEVITVVSQLNQKL